jgi:hypothetical protein
MSPRRVRRESKSTPPDHPMVPGSILYRALQQVARAVAKRLAGRSDARPQVRNQSTPNSSDQKGA